MANKLNNLHWRLRRARLHMNNFNREARRFIKSIQHEVITEKDSDGANQTWRIIVKGGKEPPLRLSLIASDCIHNLRSVLDNLIWQLGYVSGCSSTKLGDLSFPVTTDPTAFTAWMKKFNCIPQPAIDIIRSLQPYELYKGDNDPYSHPLWILNRLWGNDKHRIPALMLTSHKTTGIMPKFGAIHAVKTTDGRRMQQFVFDGEISLHTGGIFQDSKVIATITLPVGQSEPQFNIAFAFDIAFDIEGPAKGKYATEYLKILYNFVRDEVLTPIESIFPK
jgi:hypothetical protein